MKLNHNAVRNIVVDLGNTFSKMGLYSDGNLLEAYHGLSDSDLLEKWQDTDHDRAIIASVRKEYSFLLEAIEDKEKVLFLDHNTPLPLKNLYNSPQTLGVDRLAGVVGAQGIFPGRNCLVIDIGTAITYDIINDRGEYLGGGISPGPEIKLKALHNFTDNLPLVERTNPIELIGTTTRESILSGVFEGTLAEIEGFIAKYSEIFDKMQVIMCGGGLKLFESKIKEHIFVAPELIIDGLNRILEYNVSEES